MVEINLNLSRKQGIAWRKLTDKKTQELLYGGGAGGGKSFLGCVWLIYCCISYPGTRWLIGRAVLKALKESTLKTFLEIVSNWGLTKELGYNSVEGYIKFNNGSEVILKDLAYY